ncbi:hypothetical protein GCM10017710_15260 [Arthrobacter ramosus]
MLGSPRSTLQAVLAVDAEIFAECFAFAIGAEQAALLQDRNDSVDEGLHSLGNDTGDDQVAVRASASNHSCR